MRSKSYRSQFLAAWFILASLFAAIPATVFAYEPDDDERPKTSWSNENVSMQEAGGEHHEGEVMDLRSVSLEHPFDAGQMIMHHIGDAHSWHIVGHFSVPLPVIIKTDKGFEFFMSSVFNSEDHKALVAYDGKHYTYALHEEHIVAIDPNNGHILEEVSVLDLSITKNVLTMFIVFGIMFILFMNVAKAYKKRPGQAPRGLQSFLEPLIIFVRDDVAKASIGEKKYERYMPYLLTAFFFIWISNLLGLIPILPGGANLTGNIAITATLAVFTFLITTFSGNAHYWRHMLAMPGVPVGILVLLTPIEILGIFLRPFVLMIRLFANISAGHIIALAFFSLIFVFGNNGQSTGAGLGVAVLSVAFTVFMMVMELLVAFLQAYVFTLLSAIYIGSAVEEGHHDDHGHDHDHVKAPAAAH